MLENTVFVSYAHESEAFQAQVKLLCNWLRGKGIAVVCDFDYASKPPDLGWASWMQQGIEDAKVVLVVASPKYKERCEKRGILAVGKGVTWEGAIITQDLYDATLRNDKFYPILPDAGSEEHIPKALKQWQNNYRFPSGQEKILALIHECFRQTSIEHVHQSEQSKDSNMDTDRKSETSGKQSSGDGSKNSSKNHLDNVSTSHVSNVRPDPATHCCEETRKEAVDRLTAVKNSPFYKELIVELNKRIAPKPTLDQVEDVVAFVSDTLDTAAIQALFYAIRNAMDKIDTADQTGEHQLDAASALYYMASRGLIIADAFSNHTGQYLLRMPRLETKEYPEYPEPGRIIGGFIAAAICGGVLEFRGNGKQRLPEHVRTISISDNADEVENQIDRALYKVLFPERERATFIADGSAALTESDIDAIKAKIDDWRIGNNRAVAFHIQNGELIIEALGKAGLNYKTPMLLEQSQVMEEIFGMSPGRLLAELSMFWEKDAEIRNKKTTPEKSQGGSGNNQQEIDLLIKTLLQIVSVTDNQNYTRCANQVAEEVKKPQPDKSKLKSALNELKEAPKSIEGANAIIVAATNLFKLFF